MNISSNEKENSISIYAIANKYGYKYNVNHPFINNLYYRYKKWKCIAYSDPLSDKQRHDFENYVDSLFENAGKDGYTNVF